MMIALVAAVLPAGFSVFLVWRNYRLKRDIYDFTEKLDAALLAMLREEELAAEPGKTDDLWGKVYEWLARLSRMYMHKNGEIAEEKEKLKELISDISHQTRTPLANIKLYLELLEDEEAEDQQDTGRRKEILEKMDGQVDKLDFLLQSMVKMSRLETGAIQIRKQPAAIFETLAEAVGAVVPRAEAKKIQIRVDCDENLAVSHDRKWTGEALFNILDNGVKYTGEGGKIDISVCRQEIFTKISITDNGKGIAPERQGRIFQRFYREPEIHDSEGIGIGLYLAREIITLQNGYIEVKSEAGRGSTFCVYLPNTLPDAGTCRSKGDGDAHAVF